MSLKILDIPEPILNKRNNQRIENEIIKSRDMNKCIITSGNYEVFLLKRVDCPYCILEIGRLRELTFREIGEGTNKTIDLDQYDEYYHHLILWDKLDKQIVGAYRLGMGRDIYRAFGINGFYLNSLFDFNPEIHKMMSQSIEMGRAFIVKHYQKKPLPLLLLWKGIIQTTQLHPNYKFLIGGVSISNVFSEESKSYIIEFMKLNYFDNEKAILVNPKNAFKTDKNVLKTIPKNVQELDKIIREIECGKLRLPVLLKKYVKQNVKFIAFNIDPLFNNVIDGLMYVKIENLSLAELCERR